MALPWYGWLGIGVGVVVVGGIAASVLSRPSVPELPVGPIQGPIDQHAGGTPVDAGAEVARGVTNLLRDLTRVAADKVARDDVARERARDRADADLHAPKDGVSERNREANEET